MTMKPGSDQDACRNPPPKKRLARVAYVFADVRLSPSEMLGISVSFTRPGRGGSS